MISEGMKIIASKAIKFVEDFFSCLGTGERAYLPPVLRSPGTWMVSYDKTALGIFFLDKSSLRRVTEYQNKGWHPFPGFLIGEDQRPPESPVAIKVSGSCNLFSSNSISNMFGFCVSREASFTVVDHFQEIRDASGQEFKYQVDLAFVLGIRPEEDWSSVEPRLSELINHTMTVWRKIT